MTVDAAGPAAGTGTADIALTMDGVHKTYPSATGAAHRALLPTDAVVADGEFVSLVGPSGCGKTTLLKMCAGLVPPTGGDVTYRQTGATVTPGVFGIVFQSPGLLPWRTVLGNVLLPADVLRLDRARAKTRGRELLELVGLQGTEEKYPGELSGGMQQRVAIARALLHDPDILFMDEPFGALDAMTREVLNMELQNVHTTQHKTIIFVTHNIQEAVLLSDRVLVFSGSPGEVIADVGVPLRRPRQIEDEVSADFRGLESKIRALLNTNS